jgi:hypothetical protein
MGYKRYLWYAESVNICSVNMLANYEENGTKSKTAG